jgi:hypothetical protein
LIFPNSGAPFGHQNIDGGLASFGGTGEAPVPTPAQTDFLEAHMKADTDKLLREHLLYLVKGGGAHAKFENVIAGLAPELRGRKAPGLPHSIWMLVEHLRIAQWDIVEFSRNAKHVSPDFPAGYWPKSEGPPNEDAWNKSIKDFRADLKSMQDLVADPATDLFARIPWGDGQTILREALLVADHNAYHLAQIVDVRRVLGVWKG